MYGSWGIIEGETFKVTGVYQAQAEAIQNGRQLAKRQKTNFYIHGRDGRVRQKESYDIEL